MKIDCDICQHMDDPTAQVYATDKWIVNLAADQGYLGRCYVTLREHKASLSDLSELEWAEFSYIAKKLEQACSKTFAASPFNWACMMNNAFQAEVPSPHVHWHFRPRYKKTVVVGESSFTDPRYGHHYDRDQRNFVDEATFAVIRNLIETQLNT